MTFWRRWTDTPEKRIERASKDIAKRREKNREYLQECLAYEDQHLCYFCKGRGSYNTWYDDGTVRISCSVCDGSGKSHNLPKVRKLLQQGTAFDPKELRSNPRALKAALDGKVTLAP